MKQSYRLPLVFLLREAAIAGYSNQALEAWLGVTRIGGKRAAE